MEGNEPYLLISMILRHSQLGFAGVMECSLAAAVDNRTYVFGTTSTAFVWSDARRRMTHELGQIPLLDAMAGGVYLSLIADAAHTADCRTQLSISLQTLQTYFATAPTATTRQSLRSSRKQSFTCLALFQLRRTEPYAAPITQKIIVGLWGYD